MTMMTRNVLLAILLSVVVYHGVSASDAETQAGNPQLWSFQPITNPPIPAVDPSLRVKNPIDHFIFSKLNKHGLRPADETDPQSAIRITASPTTRPTSCKIRFAIHLNNSFGGRTGVCAFGSSQLTTH